MVRSRGLGKALGALRDIYLRDRWRLLHAHIDLRAPGRVVGPVRLTEAWSAILDRRGGCGSGRPGRCGVVNGIRPAEGRGVGSCDGGGVLCAARPLDQRRIDGDGLRGRGRAVRDIRAPDGYRVVNGIRPTSCRVEFRVARGGRWPCRRGHFCRRIAGRGYPNRRARRRRARSDDPPRPRRRRRGSSGPRGGHRLPLGHGRCFGRGLRSPGLRYRNRQCARMVESVAELRLGGRDGCLQRADRPGGVGDEPLQCRYHRPQFARVDPRRLTHDVSRLSSSGRAAVRRHADLA